jgi:hypothetical protein
VFVNGRDCVVVFRGAGWEVVVPYSEETVREAFALLAEEAPIEGAGRRGALLRRSPSRRLQLCSPCRLGSPGVLFL